MERVDFTYSHDWAVSQIDHHGLLGQVESLFFSQANKEKEPNNQDQANAENQKQVPLFCKEIACFKYKILIIISWSLALNF